jgi:hypothetical protein
MIAQLRDGQLLSNSMLLFLRDFCTTHTEKGVKGAGLRNTAAMLNYWRIVNASGIQEWHGHDH